MKNITLLFSLLILSLGHVYSAETHTANSIENSSFQQTPTVRISYTPVDCFGVLASEFTIDRSSSTRNTQDLTYLWSTGETTANINVYNNGVYSVFITDLDTGFSGTGSFTVTDLSSIYNPYFGYTIYGDEEVKLEKSNVVLDGDVGVSDANGKIELKYNSSILDIARAVEVKLEGGSTTGGIDLSQALSNPINFVSNPYSEGAEDIEVEDGETLTISGQIYKNIKVEENATLIIQSTTLFAKKIETKTGAEIRFTDCTNIIVEKGMKLYKNNTFNPTAENVTVYSNYNVEIKEGTEFVGNILVNDKYLDVKGENGNPTNMIGYYAAKKVDGKYFVNWTLGEICSSCEIDIPANVASCECKGGLTQLTVEYIGGTGASLSVNSGVITDNGDGTYTVAVATGEDKLENDFEITDGNLTGEIHTSCSRDIIGNIFGGGFTLIEYIDRENNLSTIETCAAINQCECKGGLTQLTIDYAGGSNANLQVNSGIILDNGDGTYTVTVANGEDKLESNFEITDGNLTGEIHTSCSQEILGNTFAGQFTVNGYIDRDGNISDLEICGLAMECICNEGMTELLIRYNGIGNPSLQSNSGIITDNLDGTYTVVVAPGEDKLEENFTITDGQLTGEINTSCSEDIIDMFFGQVFEVLFYIDVDGNSCGMPVIVDPFRNVSIFPNPSNGQFNVKIDTVKNVENVKINIYSISHGLIKQIDVKSNEDYNFGEDLERGLYFVEVVMNDSVKVYKVLKE